jgi:Na+-driven multidrug efflux pump
MESRAPEGMSSAVSTSTGTKFHAREGRNFWVLTAYGVSGLALFGILAYYFSDFISH